MKVNHPVRVTTLLVMCNSGSIGQEANTTPSYVNCSKYNVPGGTYFPDLLQTHRLCRRKLKVPCTKLLLTTQIKDEFATEGVREKTI